MVPSKLLPIQYFHEQTTHRDAVSFHQAIPFEGLILLPYISTQFVVGSVHQSSDWKTPHDFLIDKLMLQGPLH